MNEYLRRTGIDAVGDVPWGTHFCHFYETNSDLLDTLVPYLKAGLDNHEFCMWVVPEVLSQAEAAGSLRQVIPDLDSHLRSGAIEIVMHRDWYLEDGTFNLSRVIDAWKAKLDRALSRGYAGIRVTGDASGVKSKGWVSAYEKAFDHSISDLRMTALCTYPLNGSGAAQVLDAVCNHEFALARRNGSLEVVETSESRKANAEIQHLNQELEGRVAERTTALETANEELRKEIIERNRAEKALKKREAQLMDAQRLSHIGSWEWNLRDTIEWSDELYRIWGVNRTEFIPTIESITQLVHPDDRPGFIALIERAGREKQVCIHEYRIVWPDGTIRTVQARGSVIGNEHGEIIKMFGTVQDITERKRAEEELREAVLKYRNIFENAGEGIFQTTREGRFIIANPACARMFGYDSPEELIASRNDIERQHYVEPLRRQEFIRLVEQNGYLKDFEYEAYRKDGSTLHITANVRAVREQDGTLLYYEGTAQDITERRRAENALRQQTAVLQRILDHLPLMIRVSGEDGRMRLVSRGWEETLGWTLEDAQSPSVDVYSEMYPDPLTRREVLDFLAAATGEWKDFKTRLRDGRIIDTSWAVVSLPDGSSMGIGQDIGARTRADEAVREAEQKYRELFENSRDAIYVHDLNGKYTSVNPAAEKLVGLSQDQILGKHFVDFVAPKYVHKVREHLCRKLGKEGETSYEVEVIGRAGIRIPVEVSSRLIRKNGVAVGVQGTAHDITERKQAEEALRNYSRRLIEAQEEERQRIARELHDQIGQILTAVQFNLHTIQQLCGTTEASTHAAEGLRVLDEALEQVRDLSLDLRPSLLDDLGLVPALRWYIDRQARPTGVRVQILTELPHPEVRFSRELETACFRIAQEALTNVVRHSEARRVSIRLQVEGDDLLLVIKDDGVGFDLNHPRKSAPSIATLGLRGMQERARAVGGSIQVFSSLSKGTEVRSRFPIKNFS